MIIKRKKEQVDEVGEVEEKKESGLPKKPQKIKDLAPQNRKKRKQPIRPWNKYDRIILLAMILVTSIASYLLSLSSGSFNFSDLLEQKIKFLFPPRTIVLGPQEEENQKRLIIEKFQEKISKLSGTYGLYVEDLESGYSFGLRESTIFEAASLIKLPVMVGMFKEAEEGRIDLDSIYKLKADDKLPGSGSLYKKPVGYEISYRELIKLMGKESDNTAFNICRKYLGDSKIQSLISQIGMRNTKISINQTTPEDVGVFFSNLWKGKLIGKRYKEEILNYLTSTIYEKHLAAGIPPQVRIAHKYGREVGVVNDAGIVYSQKPYIVVIMSKNVVLKEADTVFPDLSRIVYEEMVKVGY